MNLLNGNIDIVWLIISVECELCYMLVWVFLIGGLFGYCVFLVWVDDNCFNYVFLLLDLKVMMVI